MGRLLSLLGSTRRILVVLAVLGVVVGGGGVLAGVLGAPSVAAMENRFGGVNDTATVVETDLVVSNPNPVGVRLGNTSVDYAVAMNDVAMAEGGADDLALKTGNSTISLRTALANERIPDWWVSHLRAGEHTTVAVDADVHSSLLGRSFDAPPVEKEIDTDVSSAFDSTETRPIEANQPFVSDPVLYLNETGGEWGEVTDARTPVEMEFVLFNPKSYPISASRFDYEIAMNDVEMGSGSTDSEVVIPPGETRTIRATTTIRNEHLDDWWVSHVERNQVTDLTIDFYARFDLLDESVRVHLDRVNHRIETDVFGTKNETREGSGADGATPTATATEEGGSTPTPTEGADTPTPTDDGGLFDGQGTATDDGSGTPTDGDGATATPTDGGSTPTPTDDGGLLGSTGV